MTLVKLENAPVTRAESGGEGNARLLYALSVEQYHLMMREGILPEGEPFELVEGQVVRKERHARGSDPMTVGPLHAVAIGQLDELNSKLRRFGCFMRKQLPVTISKYNEPEPDGAVVRGKNMDYVERHPGPGDVTCTIEVSDATLGMDRGTKQHVYANAGIEQYVIVNLAERVVEVYTRPMVGKGRYANVVYLGPDEKVSLSTGKGRALVVPAKHFFM